MGAELGWDGRVGDRDEGLVWGGSGDDSGAGDRVGGGFVVVMLSMAMAMAMAMTW